MIPRLENPTGRNTQAHIFTDAEGNEYFFSYQTCIAYRGQHKGHYQRFRRKNDWGPTTGRHFKELGCKDFPEFAGEVFEAKLS